MNFYLNDGWLHLLLRQNSDRRQGGSLRVGGSRLILSTFLQLELTYDCFSYQVGSTVSLVDNIGRDMSVNYPSQWPYNMASGSIAASIQVNEQRSEQTCSLFTEPGQRKIEHYKIIPRNLDNRTLLILMVISYG